MYTPQHIEPLAEVPMMTGKRAWKCEVCGYVHEGDSPPDQCPVCGVGSALFTEIELQMQPAKQRSVNTWRCGICGCVHEGPNPPDECPLCGAGPEHFEPVDTGPAGSASEDIGEILIIGTGVAGLTAAEKARATSPSAKITVISKEQGPPYYRLNLTRLLAGEVDEPSLVMQPKEWFREKAIELIHGEVTDVVPYEKHVILKGGQNVTFDRLILANGSHPFIPPFEGAARGGVHVLRTLEDAKDILDDSRDATNCVCIGGGLLGLEAAGALSKHGKAVSIVEGFGWLLPRQLPEPAGRMLAEHIKTLGIEIFSMVRVKALTGDESVRGVLFEDGQEIPADMVVLSTGVRSNSYLARRCNMKVSGGIVVDDQMRTSVPDVYAAGDVAEHRGASYGIWPVAYAQGVTAGINAAGGDVEYVPVPPSNRLKVMDVEMFSIGVFEQTDASFEVFEESDANTFKRLLMRDGRLLGAVLYGDTSTAGPVKDAVERGTQLLEATALLERLPAFARFIGAG
jgi:nitrite reductase (NADH) large subunit